MELASMVVFTGNANRALAEAIVRHLRLPLGKAHVGRFSDGEINVEIMENVRGRDVFIVQSTCPPTNDMLMELLVMTDACRRASAGRITAVMPYYGYARQDRRSRASRVAISSKLVASMIAVAGVDQVLTVDLHADQIQGFFDIPVDNVYSSPVLLGDAQTAADWSVRAFPTYYVIDASGRIDSRSVGYSTWLGMWARGWLAR